jgi:hypothetical protein
MEDSRWLLETAVEKYYSFRSPVLMKTDGNNQVFILSTLECQIHLSCPALLQSRSVASNSVVYSDPGYEWVSKLTVY